MRADSNQTYSVAWHGPLALLDHGLNSLGDLGSGLGNLVYGQVLERAGVLDVGKGLVERGLLLGDLADGSLGSLNL